MYAKISSVVIRKKGERIGYGEGDRFDKDSKLGIINVGYIHGFPKLKNPKVICKDIVVPVIGGVNMMNMCIDISEIPRVKVGDYVTLFSVNAESSTSIMNLADENNCIPNTLVCGVNYYYTNRW